MQNMTERGVCIRKKSLDYINQCSQCSSGSRVVCGPNYSLPQLVLSPSQLVIAIIAGAVGIQFCSSVGVQVHVVQCSRSVLGITQQQQKFSVTRCHINEQNDAKNHIARLAGHTIHNNHTHSNLPAIRSFCLSARNPLVLLQSSHKGVGSDSGSNDGSNWVSAGVEAKLKVR